MKNRIAGALVLFAHLGAALGASAQAAPPDVIRVRPRGASNQRDVVLTIEGTSFGSGSQAFLLDAQRLRRDLVTEVAGPGLLRAVVPAGTPPGMYDVGVDNGTRVTDSLAFGLALSDGTAFADAVSVPGPGQGYALRSIPQFCTVGDLLAALERSLGGYNPALYRVLLWRGGRYRELTELPRDADLSAESFWVLSQAGGAVGVASPDVYSAVPAGSSQFLVLVLDPGWNQISQPFFDRAGDRGEMDWSNVFLSTDSQLSNPISTTSTGGPTFIGFPYAWDGTGYIPVTRLRHGEGYFVNNRTAGPLYLILDRTYVEGPLLPKAAPRSASESDGPPPPPPMSLGSVDSSGSGSCGLVGFEAAALLALARLRARRRRVGA